ncbi:hypothetical protein QVD17_11596 [Tagetes erecta]|uniref:Auxin response factor n=1 Tax=Tagetes erecta TaxID=13708 RepID=A0AAD8KZW9_TARER|nr:hypothetical protein QVD17_11596 [Tagetes erecta]
MSRLKSLFLCWLLKIQHSFFRSEEKGVDDDDDEEVVHFLRGFNCSTSSSSFEGRKMITFMDAKEKLKETEKCLDAQLWHACAGSMIQMPPVNSKVYYFPQGHAEHAAGNVDFSHRNNNGQSRIPAWIPCQVVGIKFMADINTDEVYAKIKLTPVTNSGEFSSFEDEETVVETKPTSFAKTLTQSDANNGGGFSVPRYCAETIFPRLDYSSDPPVQTILAKDVHGDTWKFRHIYRGTPRRHLLTTGWSTFVNHKKLVAGDSIVFLRSENGDLCVGIRRAKRGIGGSNDGNSGWNPAGGNCVIPYGGYSPFVRNNSGGSGNCTEKMKIESDDVIEAVKQAMNGRQFEVVFYPRASTPEFCVKAALVKNAMQIRWSPGMRFKMPFETEDSSRISWFMGTISSIQVADPIRWPDSPWRLLQVTWDEPDLLQNVKRVNPWLVELVSTMPTIHVSPFSPPRKKCRPSSHPDYPMETQMPIPIPALCGPHSHMFGGPTTGPFGYQLPENFNVHPPASMQGARQMRYGLSLTDIQLNNKLNSSFYHTNPKPSHSNPFVNKPTQSEPISCLLTIGNSSSSSKEPETPKSRFLLFGQPILTEQQISENANVSCSGSRSRSKSWSDQEMDLNLETGHCKVFMESEDVGRTLDLSLLNSYEELCTKLANMFKLESALTLNRVHYCDVTGTFKQIGEEPFSEFSKTTRRLKIVTESSSDK